MCAASIQQVILTIVLATGAVAITASVLVDTFPALAQNRLASGCRSSALGSKSLSATHPQKLPANSGILLL